VKLPPGITTSANPPPNRATSVLRDGSLLGEYERSRCGGYRWRSQSGGYGDASTAHLAIVAIVELADRGSR